MCAFVSDTVIVIRVDIDDMFTLFRCLKVYVVCCDIFTARCYASAVLAMGLCPSVSVTSRCSTKMAKRRITQTTPHETSGSLVF